MKSKVLKIRNLPEEMQVLNEVKVKPIGSLLVLMLVSGVFIISGSTIAIMGVVLLAISSYALLVMPDRILMQFTDEYLVLYNRKNRDECMLIYWDEILLWQYQKHNKDVYKRQGFTYWNGSLPPLFWPCCCLCRG